MCGIIGQFGGLIERSKFERARDRMKHRGPDDAGVFYDSDSRLALGNRRLAIIDLSPAGHQPMVSADGRWAITFNGEIFNYIELRRELEGRYPFRTQSDTEVLLAAFSVWGPAGLPKLNGQFAFAIWDSRDKTLYLARDHFGVKPLFYSSVGGTLYFASEIKVLLALGLKPRPNEGVIFEYLAYGLYDHGPETFFDGIMAMPPSHYAVFKDGELSVRPYWDLAEAVRVQKPPSSEAEAVDKLHELITDAIRLQMRSDVPVGVNLSSGIDSAVLLHFLSLSLGGGEVHAFTSCLADDLYDECRYMRPTLLDEPDVSWHTATLAPDAVFDIARDLIAVVDQPYGGIHTMQYFNLYRKTARTSPVTVLLEGQGMDEIQGGYRHYLPGERQKFLEPFRNFPIQPAYLGSEFIKQASNGADRKPQIKMPFDDDLKNAQFIDLIYRKLPRTLRINDHISMAFSKELRLPYLDPRLVVYCLVLPEEYKISGDDQKLLERKLIQDRIPDAMRPKDLVEFPAFQTKWFREHLRGPTMEFLSSATFRSRPYWDHEKLMSAVGRFFAGEGEHSFFLWQMIDLEMWHRKFID